MIPFRMPIKRTQKLPTADKPTAAQPPIPAIVTIPIPAIVTIPPPTRVNKPTRSLLNIVKKVPFSSVYVPLPRSNNVRIYVLCHTDERYAQAIAIYEKYYWAIPLRMTYQDCTFENAVWKQLLEIKNEWIHCDMVGTISFMASKKINLTDIDRIIADTRQWHNGHVGFLKVHGPFSNDHPHLLKIMTDVCNTLKLNIPRNASFCNYMMCSPMKMIQYIRWFEEIYKPVVLAHPLAMTDAKYPYGSVTAHQLQQKLGIPYYPHVPFVMERLSNLFFENYFSIAIVSVFKNEAHILKEWIDHYLNEGVSCFLLTDNGSTDNYLPVLQPYIDKGAVILRVDPAKHKQVDHLNTMLGKAKQFSWVIGVDLDEFLYARNGFSTIKQYLMSVNKSIGAISVPWKFFGSNGHIEQPAGVIQNFTLRKKYDHSFVNCKTLIRGELLTSMHVHFHNILKSNYILSDGTPLHQLDGFTPVSESILTNSFLHLNHYVIQSWEYFSSVKMTRGDVSAYSSDSVRDEAYFKAFDHKDMDDYELKHKKYTNVTGALS